MSAPLQHPEVDRWLKPVALAGAIGMFIVLLMGATVTNTNSAEGCGRSWPMCHGQFGSRAMLIESSHRLVTGGEGFIVLATAIGLWRTRKQLFETKFLIAAMFIGILLQSGMGAWAVARPQSSIVLALHFGISMAALAACALTAEFVYRDRLRPNAAIQMMPGKFFRWSMWFSLVAMYGIAYIGAYLRHSNSTLACSSWPDCNGKIIPTLHGAIGINFAHRIAAVLGTVLVFGLLYLAYNFRSWRPDLYRVTQIAALAIVAQSIAGAIVVTTRLSYASTLMHSGFMAILFTALCIGCRMILPEERVEVPETAVRSTTAAMATGD